MINDKIITRVSASFAQNDQLFNTIRKYAQSSDDHFARWDEFFFTCEPLQECDALLVFNTPGERVNITCYPERVIAFMMEPGIKVIHPWMFEKTSQYHQVYSPLANTSNTILSHGFVGWYPDYDYKKLINAQVPLKEKMMSCIASSLQALPGHRLRHDFVERLRRELPDIDQFGRGSNFLEDKMQGLQPYRYSVAIENSAQPHYFTEKINDCFLAYTVPVYFGCTNIHDYFPEKAIVTIDIKKPTEAIDTIKLLLEKNDWEDRLPSLMEARENVLNKYQPLAGAAGILRNIKPGTRRKNIVLHRSRANLMNKIRHRLLTTTGFRAFNGQYKA